MSQRHILSYLKVGNRVCVIYAYGDTPSKVRVYNLQEKKLDPRIISGYFIGYAEESKGYRFYCTSHSTRIVKSRNAKFIENDLISESNQSQDLVFVRDEPSTSSDRLVIIHNAPQVSSLRA